MLEIGSVSYLFLTGTAKNHGLCSLSSSLTLHRLGELCFLMQLDELFIVQTADTFTVSIILAMVLGGIIRSRLELQFLFLYNIVYLDVASVPLVCSGCRANEMLICMCVGLNSQVCVRTWWAIIMLM